MAFVLEFMEHFIRGSMEDPNERYEKWVNHMRVTKEAAEKSIDEKTWPTKPYGYWNLDKNNFRHTMDQRFNRLSGRENPWEVAERRVNNS